MTAPYEAIIAGAGPAGVAVGARLAQHGRGGRILVLDRFRFPREKPCGGALTGHAEPAMAALDLTLRVPSWPCGAARVRFGAFERVVAMGRAVQVIRRRDFDADLVEQARERGIEVIEGEGVESYAVERDGVRVTTSAGRELRAEVLIGADGAASVVRKHLGGPSEDAGREIPHRLFQIEVDLPTDQAPAMLYDFTPMAHGLRGYLWIFPVPGARANLGLMHYPTRAPSSRRGGRELVELLRRGLIDHGVDLPARGTRGWPVWGYDPRRPVSAARVVTVGDAAGIDGLTGEGIAVAMEQAIVAGDAVDRALRERRFDFGGYRRALRRAPVGRELALDRRLARLLYDTDRWLDWLALVLVDPDMIEMYARRVDGTEILADQKLRLVRALAGQLVRGRRRRRVLEQASGLALFRRAA
ncbi:MAG TPA: NAD(P)/FAD-dependent oxidoreductase [Kofleriaceae bacterium]|nr:NAD(P)/FAD-dependent oxidoreductase [Kofleriaceae bacterium]